MRYATIRYVEVGSGYRLLHLHDGTCRGVVFEDEEAAAAAMIPGRAGMDVVAIGNGFLPRGATLVSRAGAGDIDAIMAETADPGETEGPLARVRLAFSLGLLVERSRWISSDTDAAARGRQPVEAARYEAIVDELVRFHRDTDA